MLELNPTQLALILDALLAVSPSGGGSPQYTLARHLRDHGVQENQIRQIALQERAAREYFDA